MYSTIENIANELKTNYDVEGAFRYVSVLMDKLGCTCKGCRYYENVSEVCVLTNRYVERQDFCRQYMNH